MSTDAWERVKWFWSRVVYNVSTTAWSLDINEHPSIPICEMPASRLERLLLRPTRSAVIAHLVLLIASGYWQYKVSAIVPEPYLVGRL